MSKQRFLDRVPLSPKQSLKEEVANAITHGIGVGLAIAALVILVVFAARISDTWKVVSFSIYGATMIILFLSSTLYHSFPQPYLKRFFRIMDHSSIFLLIAGTYTPVTIGSMRGGWGWPFLGSFGASLSWHHPEDIRHEQAEMAVHSSISDDGLDHSDRHQTSGSRGYIQIPDLDSCRRPGL
jgi:predicted membrane channel-forming protein YqfA (hemolysin III family)